MLFPYSFMKDTVRPNALLAAQLHYQETGLPVTHTHTHTDACAVINTVACLCWLFYGVVAGHVGAPLPCNDIKLVDVAEMNYYAAQGEGEVCACVCFNINEILL